MVDCYGALLGINVSTADTSFDMDSADVGVENMAPVIREWTLRVDVIGHGLLIRGYLPHLRANTDGGAVVCISSAADRLGEDARPAYGACKSVVNALVRHTASRWGKEKIRTNAVAPGLVITSAMDVPRPGLSGCRTRCHPERPTWWYR